jgi:hypothetical protein
MMAMILWILGLEYGYECEEDHLGMKLRGQERKDITSQPTIAFLFDSHCISIRAFPPSRMPSFTSSMSICQPSCRPLPFLMCLFEMSIQ